MIRENLKEQILRLPVEEQLKLIGEVWDEITADPAAVPVPDWHLGELDRRQARSDPDFVPWSEVRDLLDRTRSDPS